MVNLMRLNNFPSIQINQSGNVFVIILVGIALFGALGFTFSKSANKGTGNLTKQQAKIAAQDILNYASLMEGAVDRVRRNGCSETEISFENDVIDGYTNPNAPSDKSCHIFNSHGGKITYAEPNSNWLNPNNNTEIGYSEFRFIAENTIFGLHDNTKDTLLLILPWIKKSICEEINFQIFSDSTISEDAANFFYLNNRKSIGVFDSAFGGIDLNANPTFGGKPSACFSSVGSGGYHYYHALLVR